jgi:hypothetical protein
MIPLWLRKICIWVNALILLGVLSSFTRTGSDNLGDSPAAVFLFMSTASIILILDSLICIINKTAKSYWLEKSYNSGLKNITEYSVYKNEGKEAIRLSLFRLIYPLIVLGLIILYFEIKIW